MTLDIFRMMWLIKNLTTLNSFKYLTVGPHTVNEVVYHCFRLKILSTKSQYFK